MKKARNGFTLSYLYLVVVIALGLMTIISTSGCGGDGGGGGGGDTDLSHNEVIAKLGIVTDLQDYPTDSEGNPLEGNPLGKNTGVLHPIKEIFFMGLKVADGISNDLNNHLYDDSKQNWE